MIRLEHINVKAQTLLIPGTNSKNRKDGVITIPQKVMILMLELQVLEHSADCYLFSDKFRPGASYRSEKQFRDYWAKIRQTLHFGSAYKFYSLKDTGITTMLRKCDALTVRDQARHADLLMTDTYTPHDLQCANEALKLYE